MTRESRSDLPLQSPIDLDWTLAALLEWIGADDRRCHDARLRDLLEAIDPGAPVRSFGVVVLVRSLAARVVAEPTLGARRIRDVLGLPVESGAEADRVLLAV